jgi:hypothetical protein
MIVVKKQSIKETKKRGAFGANEIAKKKKTI